MQQSRGLLPTSDQPAHDRYQVVSGHCRRESRPIRPSTAPRRPRGRQRSSASSKRPTVSVVTTPGAATRIRTPACTALRCVVAAGTDVPTGCPSISRLGLAVPACNPDSKTCIGATVAAGCTNDNSCKGKQIFDSPAGDLCTTGECTCYAGNKQCYRKCARDIDCAAGKLCDAAKTKLCLPDAACATDSQCAIANHNVNFKCNDGTCAQACETDLDCSPSGVSAPFTGKVCGADKFCASVAQDCNEETQCPATAGGLKPFCVTPPPVPGAPVGIVDHELNR